MASPTYTFRLSQHGLDLDPAGQHARSWPSACRAATTATITISTALNNGDSLDGVTLATGDRVLVKDQSTASQNGIYIVGASPARAEDYDTSVQIVGSVVIVSEGTTNGDTAWLCTTNATVTVGSTGLAYTAFGTGGGGGTPTLADVLGAGNDTTGTSIISDDPGNTSPPTIQLSSHAFITGGDYGSGDPGGYVELLGGSGDGGAGGGDVVIDGGYADGTGGSIWHVAGNAKSGTNTDGGDVVLDPGSKDGSGRIGLVILVGLPTSDPGVSGAVWNSSGTLKISP